MLIGICGPSGSGKSTLARELCGGVGKKCTIIKHDSYYRSFPLLSFEERVLLNYDDPDIFDNDLFLSDIQTLLAGNPITKKNYNYSKHLREDSDELIYPEEIIIVEGIHVFYDQRLCDLMFLKLYMQVDPDICLLRRISRDINERGRDIDNISAQYITTVKPMFDKHIRNYVNHADVIVAHGGKNTRIIQILSGYVRDSLQDDYK